MWIKVRRRRLLDERDGVEKEQDAMPPGFNDLLHKAGSSTFKPQSIPGMSAQEGCSCVRRLLRMNAMAQETLKNGTSSIIISPSMMKRRAFLTDTV